MKKIVFLLLLLPRLAFGAVAVDADSSATCTGCSTLSWSHTVGASGTLLACSITNVEAGSPTSTVTFNAVSMTAHTLLDSLTGGLLDLWYKASPAVGTHTTAVTLTGTVDAMAGGCTSFTGANGTPGGSITAVGTSPSAIIDGVAVTVPTNGMAFGVALYGFAACTNEAPDTGNTERYDVCADAGGNNAGAFAVTRTTSGQVVWTNRPSGASEALIVVPIYTSTPPAGGVRRMVVTVQ